VKSAKFVVAPTRSKGYLRSINYHHRPPKKPLRVLPIQREIPNP